MEWKQRTTIAIFLTALGSFRLDLRRRVAPNFDTWAASGWPLASLLREKLQASEMDPGSALSSISCLEAPKTIHYYVRRLGVICRRCQMWPFALHR